MRVLAFTILLIISLNRAWSLPDTLIYKSPSYPFINKQKNVLTNTQSLDVFFEKLYQLRQQHASRMSVLHIGDSHIQADFISSVLRTNLQKEFGNGGRGLIVPLRIAGSNEPFNYRTGSNIKCDRKRCVFYEDSLFEYGIGGHTIQTTNDSLEINITTFNYPPLNYAFNKLTLYYKKDSSSFDFTVKDTLGNMLGELSHKSKESADYLSSIQLPSLTNDLLLVASRKDSSQTQTTIYGMMVENDSAGIMLHTVGVNGAEAFHYVYAKHFAVQTTSLNPNLIIISLGTNEAQRRPFDKALTAARLDSLVKLMQLYHPGIPILLTTPPDSYYGRKYYNPSVSAVRSIIIEYAGENNIPVWDLFSVGGGYKSCYQWKKYGLMRRDGIHFNRTGYELQGSLLYEAIVKAYNQYVITRHP